MRRTFTRRKRGRPGTRKRNVDDDLSTFRGTWPNPLQQINHVHACKRRRSRFIPVVVLSTAKFPERFQNK